MKCVLEKFVSLCWKGAQHRHAVTSSTQSRRSLVYGKSAVGELPSSACFGQIRKLAGGWLPMLHPAAKLYCNCPAGEVPTWS
jgi:hypothetical protein